MQLFHRHHHHPHSNAAPSAARITDVIIHTRLFQSGDRHVTTATLAGTTPVTRVDDSVLALTDIQEIDVYDDIGDGKGPQKIGSIPAPAATFTFTTGVLSVGNHIFTGIVLDTSGHSGAPSNAAAVTVAATLAAPSPISDLTVTLNLGSVTVPPPAGAAPAA
jgi:hypothetical protein